MNSEGYEVLGDSIYGSDNVGRGNTQLWVSSTSRGGS